MLLPRKAQYGIFFEGLLGLYETLKWSWWEFLTYLSWLPKQILAEIGRKLDGGSYWHSIPGVDSLARRFEALSSSLFVLFFF